MSHHMFSTNKAGLKDAWRETKYSLKEAIRDYPEKDSDQEDDPDGSLKTSLKGIKAAFKGRIKGRIKDGLKNYSHQDVDPLPASAPTCSTQPFTFSS